MPLSPLAPLVVTAAVALAACAAPVVPPPSRVATAWQSPLPHGGTVGELRRWWAQFDDPLLARLIDAAEQASPTITSAGARIAEAEARRVAASAALVPSLDASANAARGRQDLTLPLGTSANAELRASWEIDVFGGNRAARDAATERLDSAAALWHDARVVVAADTANTYVALRTCEARLAQTQLDATSRAETARLTELSRRAGFESPSNAALARASAAQGVLLVRQQVEQCDQTVKALVGLTAIAEPELHALLGGAVARVPQPAAIEVPSVPAAALAQRPDVYARAREVAAASADLGQAEAARLPRVTLTGALGAGHIAFDGGTFDGTLWSIGPI
ncbi:MAG: TolC family protein, partial [Rhizobacter sp.]|nr:TolC family protein [Rhizobacter sp.]